MLLNPLWPCSVSEDVHGFCPKTAGVYWVCGDQILQEETIWSDERMSQGMKGIVKKKTKKKNSSAETGQKIWNEN